MNVFIKMEVKARELDGRLLLGLVAAERGHEVLLGDLRTLLSHRLWLPPGIFHDKALVPSEQRMEHRDRLISNGFVLTSQDEEHGLTSDLDRFVRSRFSEASVAQAEALLAWGPKDAAALSAAFPAAAPRVAATGSPRVDLWRPEAGGHHATQDRPDDATQGYVLILTNFGVGSPNTWWSSLADIRASYNWSDDDPAEWALYDSIAGAIAHAGRIVRAVRVAASAVPDVRFVLRPHPIEGEAAWRHLVGDLPNLTVVRSGSVSCWIRAARLVVHSGSTTGYEAAIGGVPTTAYVAGGYGADLEVNRLGRRASTPDELVELVRAAGSPTAREEWFDDRDRRALTATFAALDGRLAADRIVDVWDEVPPRDHLGHRFGARRALALAEAHRAVGSARTLMRGGRTSSFRTAHKFPAFRRGEIERHAGRLRATFDRFHDVSVEVVGPRLVRIHRSRRASRARATALSRSS